MNLKPYPKYKDSGIQWIGEIPEGWEVHKLKYKTIINKKKLEDDVNPNYVINYLDISNVDSDGNILDIEEQIFEDAPSRARRIPGSGDTILSTVRTYLKAIAYLENIPDNLIVSTGFAVLEPIKPINSKYFFYSTSSEVFIQNVIAYSKGVAYPAINPPELGQILIIIPSLPEQTTIANFLDKQTAKIDVRSAKDKKLIELLKEKRTALINHAVTEGLDKNAKMKKVNLLICDENPENWQVIRIKFVIRLSRGVDLSNDDFEEGNIPVYGSNGIIGYHNEANSKGPGVTVGRSGSVGEVNFVNEERYWAHNTSLYLQEDYGNNVRYIYYLLSILDLKHLAAGSAVGTLNRNYIHDLFVSLPSKQEQQKIVEYLDKATSNIDKTIKIIEKKIKLLEEYKKSLIHHTVTGKMDVRGVEA